MSKIIQDEIKKHGNTNLITKSGLNNQIYAIGDSHTIFFHNSLKIIEHWFYHTLPLTIFRLLKEDLDIYNIGNVLKNMHELYNIKENDYVIFYFGFNDIQKNIHMHSSHRWESEIDTLITNYMNKVEELKNRYKIKPIISCIYPNPLPWAKGQNPCGSYQEERNIAYMRIIY